MGGQSFASCKVCDGQFFLRTLPAVGQEVEHRALPWEQFVYQKEEHQSHKLRIPVQVLVGTVAPSIPLLQMLHFPFFPKKKKKIVNGCPFGYGTSCHYWMGMQVARSPGLTICFTSEVIDIK